MSRMFRSIPMLVAGLLLSPLSVAKAERERVADAWWTGPIIAAGPETLPPGHVLIEPYVFDVMSGHSQTPGSRGYLLYGVAPRLTAGILPSFSYAKDAAGKRRPQMGDLTLNFQYRLTAPNPHKSFPSAALVLQEVLPTARFDKLHVAGSGSGSGAYSTLLGLYTQQYFWLPNGRILRGRVNVTHTFARTAHVRDISVYGTADGFRGSAKPGDTTMIDVAAEYSISRRFVFALDALHQWNGRTTVRPDATSAQAEVSATPPTRFYALVPAVEFNWSPNEGVILGTRLIFKGHNQTSSVTPVIAFNRYL
jgi:hypothetical protein